MGVLIKYSKSNRSFQITDRTLRQLANAGGFRILQKADADSILGYESLFRQYQNFESTIFQEAQDNVRNTYNQLADFRISFPLQNATTLQGKDTSHTELKGALLFAEDRGLLNKWFNELTLYLRVTNAQRKILSDLKNKSKEMLEYYKNKHHID